MADGIAMTYDIMDQVSKELTTIVGEIVTNKGTMMEKVNYLCESWKSSASQTHQDHFTEVGNKIDTLTQLAEELVSSITRYRAEMEQLDQSYA